MDIIAKAGLQPAVVDRRNISITLILWKRMSREKASPRPSGRCGSGDLHPAPSHSSPHS